jgi:hypothetical protein
MSSPCILQSFPEFKTFVPKKSLEAFSKKKKKFFSAKYLKNNNNEAKTKTA